MKCKINILRKVEYITCRSKERCTKNIPSIKRDLCKKLNNTKLILVFDYKINQTDKYIFRYKNINKK